MARPIPAFRLLPLAAAVLLLLGGAPALAADPGEDFTITDRNSDGFIDKGEFYERVVEQFFFADIDRDGRLVPAELPGVPADAFKGADRNGDGALSLPEFTEAREADFGRADADHDGLLSRAEAEAAAGKPAK